MWPWPCCRQQRLSIAVVWRLSKCTQDPKERSFVLTHGGSPSISHRSTLSQLLFTWPPDMHTDILQSKRFFIKAFIFITVLRLVSPALIWWNSKDHQQLCIDIGGRHSEWLLLTYNTIHCFFINKNTVGAFCISDQSNENKVPLLPTWLPEDYVNSIKTAAKM